MPVDPTPRSAYAHWNEDQDFMWWDEVGRHASTQADEPPDPDDYREDDPDAPDEEYPDWDNRHHDDIDGDEGDEDDHPQQLET